MAISSGKPPDTHKNTGVTVLLMDKLALLLLTSASLMCNTTGIALLVTICSMPREHPS